MPSKTVALSFDDACEGQRSIAAPILQEFGFGATFFICEFCDEFDTNRQQYMSWKQMQELHDLGFEIANHTLTHSNFVRNLDEQTFLAELWGLQLQAKTHGIPNMTGFAFPGGPADAPYDIQGLLKANGYRYARTVNAGAYIPGQTNPYELPAYAVHGPDLAQLQAAAALAGDNAYPILVYHGVPDRLHPWVNTEPEDFRRGMQWLADHDFRAVAIRDLPGLN